MAIPQTIVSWLLTPLRLLVYGVDWLVGRLERFIGQKRMPYFFVLPNMAIFVIFIVFPLALNVVFSFTTGESIIPSNRQFIGTANFQRLATCQNFLDYRTCQEDFFWRAISNSFSYVAVESPSMVIIALAIALALNRQIVARGFFRSAFFYPVLLSPVVVAMIWQWILQERGGLLNTIIGWFGATPISYLTDAHWALFWVIFVSIWAQVGFYALILLARLQSIPPSLYEA